MRSQGRIRGSRGAAGLGIRAGWRINNGISSEALSRLAMGAEVDRAATYQTGGVIIRRWLSTSMWLERQVMLVNPPVTLRYASLTLGR